MSPQPSRTTWPDWTPRPPVCPECEQRVTLKQSHRQQWSEFTQTGRIVHAACDPFRVRVVVELGSMREATASAVAGVKGKHGC